MTHSCRVYKSRISSNKHVPPFHRYGYASKHTHRKCYFSNKLIPYWWVLNKQINDRWKRKFGQKTTNYSCDCTNRTHHEQNREEKTIVSFSMTFGTTSIELTDENKTLCTALFTLWLEWMERSTRIRNIGEKICVVRKCMELFGSCKIRGTWWRNVWWHGVQSIPEAWFDVTIYLFSFPIPCRASSEPKKNRAQDKW